MWTWIKLNSFCCNSISEDILGIYQLLDNQFSKEQDVWVKVQVLLETISKQTKKKKNREFVPLTFTGPNIFKVRDYKFYAWPLESFSIMAENYSLKKTQLFQNQNDQVRRPHYDFSREILENFADENGFMEHLIFGVKLTVNCIAVIDFT